MNDATPQEKDADVALADALKAQRNEVRCPRAAALAREFETELYETSPPQAVRDLLETFVVTLDALIKMNHEVSPAWEAEARGYLDGARRARQ